MDWGECNEPQQMAFGIYAQPDEDGGGGAAWLGFDPNLPGARYTVHVNSVNVLCMDTSGARRLSAWLSDKMRI